jgi:predicted DNA-binding transcriptional regulator AlpA
LTMSDYLNINEAAQLTCLSIPTIRSKIGKGLLPRELAEFRARPD